VDELFAILADQTRYPASQLPATGVGDELEILLSSIFIADKTLPGFATRSCTVIIVDKEKIYHYHKEFVAEQKQQRKNVDAVSDGRLPGNLTSRRNAPGWMTKRGGMKSARRRNPMDSWFVSPPESVKEEEEQEEARRSSDSDYDPDELDGFEPANPLKPCKTVIHITTLEKYQPSDDEEEQEQDQEQEQEPVPKTPLSSGSQAFEKAAEKSKKKGKKSKKAPGTKKDPNASSTAEMREAVPRK
jgi:hypothetical protein